MKIKDLDRNEVYDLREIKKDAVKFDMLKEWLRENDKGWDRFSFNLKRMSNELYYSKELNDWRLGADSEPTKCALTLFDLDITDYQVDCTDLSKEQIEKMGSVLLSKGKDYLSSKKFALSRNHNSYFLISSDESFYITNKQDDKTTITYDKFIELFGEKKPIEQAVEELADAFEEKPSQYQIGIDTFTRAEANMTKEEILACVRFNLDKYTWRKKGQDKEDFEKIIAYANWALKNL